MDTTKIIKGVVNSGRYTVTAPIVKEDYGLYLQIEGVELPSTYQVDFSNDEHHGTSVTMIGNADGVLIPHQFIDTGKDIFAFLYHVGANYGRTVYKFRIPNKVRPDRTDDTPTPEEQSVIDQAISALNEAVAQTAQDVIDADASAQSASADADRAEQAKEDASTFAQRSANSAQASADYSASAQTSATASAQSASQSAQIKADVEDLVDDAQGYANASAQSATASANSASQASGYAQSASASAQSASGYASNSQTSANTAFNKASEASTSAQTASTKASESAQSASQALSYKNDAESAKTASQTAQGLAESARDLAQGYANDAQASAEGISASASQIAQNTANILKAFPTDTASGAVASFSDGADNIPLKSLIVNIDPVQDTSSGDPSPENICHISGWTGCEVNATNTNLCGGSKLLANAQNYIQNGTTNTEEEYFQFASGASLNYDYRFSSGVPFKEETRYTFIFTLYKTSGTGTNMRVNYTDGSYSVIPAVSSAGVKETVVYKSSDGKTILNLSKMNSSGNTRIYYNESGIFEGVLTVSDFEPYQGQTIHINWQTEAGTVYGGKLDVLSGVLRVTNYFCTPDNAARIKYGIDSQSNLPYAFFALARRAIGTNLMAKTLCSMYKAVATQRVDKTLRMWSTEADIWDSDLDVTSLDTVKAYFADLVIVYPLETPIEIQLSPTEVNSLLGQNNIFADTVDVSVEYRADTKLYINRLTEPDADMIADSNIVSGQYFMVGNNLYKATANIANGGQITVGTNCTRVSLSQALNEINA